MINEDQIQRCPVAYFSFCVKLEDKLEVQYSEQKLKILLSVCLKENGSKSGGWK